MWLSTNILLTCMLCISVALDQNVVKPTNDVTTVQQANNQTKQADSKTILNPRRRRRKFRRPFKESTLIRNPTKKFKTNPDYVDEDYNLRVNSFASAIKDTNTFLRFLRQEETKHLGNYVRRRDFNFNNHTLTTRFLQEPTNINDTSVILFSKELNETLTKLNHTHAQVLMKPSPLLSPPTISEEPTRLLKPTQETKLLDPEDEPPIRVPNRGLVPPLPTENEVFYNQGLYTTMAPIARSAKVLADSNATESVERRAPLPVKKKRARQPKNKMPEKYLKKNDDEYGELQLSVAETRYYRKRPLLVLPRMPHRYDAQQVIPGVAGKDYTVYDRPPVSKFNCAKNDTGYYADPSTGCQVFYICTGDGKGEPMLCPNGTLFNPEVLVCDWWFNVNCR